ncbi:MAG: fructosamine kinase family protein, partial [Bacteroidota bacterium]
LWSGNIMTDNFGQPVLIDPAVSYSHRETDIAMTTLFGRLPEEFYQTYTDAFKLDPGWQERLDIYNLYPLLVHVNLFGGGYLAQVMGIVKRYN